MSTGNYGKKFFKTLRANAYSNDIDKGSFARILQSHQSQLHLFLPK